HGSGPGSPDRRADVDSRGPSRPRRRPHRSDGLPTGGNATPGPFAAGGAVVTASGVTLSAELRRKRPPTWRQSPAHKAQTDRKVLFLLVDAGALMALAIARSRQSGQAVNGQLTRLDGSRGRPLPLEPSARIGLVTCTNDFACPQTGPSHEDN